MYYFRLVLRVLAGLALCLWIGGFGFFGAVMAPILFRYTREHNMPSLAPQVVALILSRFAVVTFVCAGILLLFWIVDGTARRRERTYHLQGAFLAVSLAVTCYLNLFLLPRTIADQEAVLPMMERVGRGQTLSPQEQEVRDRFDSGHKTYSRIASINLWMLVGFLACLMIQSAPVPSRKSSSEAMNPELRPEAEPLLK